MKTVSRAARRRGVAVLAPLEIERLLNDAATRYAAGRLDDAARLYARIEIASPADVRAPYSLAVIDIRRGRGDAARRRLRAVVARAPDLFAAQQNLGAVCQDLGRWDEAADAYSKAAALRPDVAETRFSLARALAILGRLDQAVACYRALAADPAVRPRALMLMAILDPAAPNDDELANLQQAAEDPAVDPETQIGLLFALADVLDRRGHDDGAFAAYASGNGLKHDALAKGPPDARPAIVTRHHAETVRFIETRLTRSFVEEQVGSGSSSAAPIFVVGMPRSGSSLIEQILGAHPKVQGMGESAALSDLIDQGFPEGAAGWRRLARDYLDAMRERGWKDAPRFVDKTLENHLRVGLIHKMFPKAVILHAVRDPVDTCLACYRQLFASGNETLYDLAQIGEAYGRYREVMAHWEAVVPGRVIAVEHEALVADSERMILWLVTEACGLGWDPACLNFHAASGMVRTASAAQVRRPIFSTSVQRWRRYERHLGPLFEALGPYAPARETAS